MNDSQVPYFTLAGGPSIGEYPALRAGETRPVEETPVEGLEALLDGEWEEWRTLRGFVPCTLPEPLTPEQEAVVQAEASKRGRRLAGLGTMYGDKWAARLRAATHRRCERIYKEV